jgi:hypothetical protein
MNVSFATLKHMIFKSALRYLDWSIEMKQLSNIKFKLRREKVIKEKILELIVNYSFSNFRMFN